MSDAVCSLCGDSIDLDDPTNFEQITVYVHGPKRDGAVLRERTGKTAHEKCVRLEAAGQAADQPSLLDMMAPERDKCSKACRNPDGTEGICDMILSPDGECPGWEDHIHGQG